MTEIRRTVDLKHSKHPGGSPARPEAEPSVRGVLRRFLSGGCQALRWHLRIRQQRLRRPQEAAQRLRGPRPTERRQGRTGATHRLRPRPDPGRHDSPGDAIPLRRGDSRGKHVPRANPRRSHRAGRPTLHTLRRHHGKGHERHGSPLQELRQVHGAEPRRAHPRVGGTFTVRSPIATPRPTRPRSAGTAHTSRESTTCSRRLSIGAHALLQ